MSLSIAVIGLGLMGRPLARRLLAAGWRVTGWNRSMLPEDLIEGIPICPHLKDAAAADVCLLMLKDSKATNSVLSRLEPHLSAGQIVLDMGSSDPEQSVAHAKRLTLLHIGWVDAPVSGGPEGAMAGTLAIMVGATEADFARVEPILQTLGSNVVRVGQAGAGHTVKVINQLIVGLTIEAVAEGLILAEKSGIDPRLVQQALRGGFADSKILQLHGSRMVERRYEPGARVETQLKDLKLAMKLAESVGLYLPHLTSAVDLYERLVAQGDSGLDHSAPHKLLWK